jgi:protease PrsW
LFAIFGKALYDQAARLGKGAFVPGLLVAIVVHATFNQLSASPFVTAAILLATMPVLLLAAFEYSERSTREWLASGFDGEMEMLESILEGAVAETAVGRYLETLRAKFDPMVVADLFCLLTIHLELSLRAKGMLLARAAGVEVPVDASVRANLEEMRYLEKTVGPTGCLAILPLRRTSRRDLWQILLLQQRA